MPSTTNFGWTTPADTDLVKDGAAAIRTLGNGIDTSFLDLKGGTSGQVLAKNSNTDLDFVWVAQDDSNAIQNAIVDAKGDLITATAADTPARLAVGSNNQVLIADSSTATGLKWGAAPAGTPTFVGCSLYATSNTSLTSGTQTAIVYNAEHFDTDGFHDNSTNNTRITIPSGKNGKYQFTFRTYFSTNSTGSRYLLPRKNGTNIKAAETMASSAGAFTLEINFILDLVATDYIENFVLQTSGSTLNAQFDTVYTEAACIYLGA